MLATDAQGVNASISKRVRRMVNSCTGALQAERANARPLHPGDARVGQRKRRIRRTTQAARGCSSSRPSSHEKQAIHFSDRAFAAEMPTLHPDDLTLCDRFAADSHSASGNE